MANDGEPRLFIDEPWLLREPCRACGSTKGFINTRGGQDTVRCADCSMHLYNAPADETGRARRSLATRPTVKPSARAAILEQFDYACVVCGRRPPDVRLEIAHLIPREAAEQFGLLDWLIDSDDNLAPMCAECNSGEANIVWTWRKVTLVRRCILMAQQVRGDRR